MELNYNIILFKAKDQSTVGGDDEESLIPECQTNSSWLYK